MMRGAVSLTEGLLRDYHTRIATGCTLSTKENDDMWALQRQLTNLKRQQRDHQQQQQQQQQYSSAGALDTVLPLAEQHGASTGTFSTRSSRNAGITGPDSHDGVRDVLQSLKTELEHEVS
jgi:hypothetical protein